MRVVVDFIKSLFSNSKVKTKVIDVYKRYERIGPKLDNGVRDIMFVDVCVGCAEISKRYGFDMIERIKFYDLRLNNDLHLVKGNFIIDEDGCERML
jgi:hypothetical protein